MMNNIDLESLEQIKNQLSQANTSICAIKHDAIMTEASKLSLRGVDEYLTTAIMLVWEVIKNEQKD